MLFVILNLLSHLFPDQSSLPCSPHIVSFCNLLLQDHFGLPKCYWMCGLSLESGQLTRGYPEGEDSPPSSSIPISQYSVRSHIKVRKQGFDFHLFLSHSAVLTCSVLQRCWLHLPSFSCISHPCLVLPPAGIISPQLQDCSTILVLLFVVLFCFFPDHTVTPNYHPLSNVLSCISKCFGGSCPATGQSLFHHAQYSVPHGEWPSHLIIHLAS